MYSDLEAISLSVPSLCQPREIMGGSITGESSGRVNPGAGTFWQDPSSCKSANPRVISLPSDSGNLLTMGKCKDRAVRVAYVRNSETSQPLSPENMALQCLKDACDIVGFKLDIIPFGKLDFGETSVLDHFYNAVSESAQVGESGGDGVRKDLVLGLFQRSPEAQPRYMHKAVGSNTLESPSVEFTFCIPHSLDVGLRELS